MAESESEDIVKHMQELSIAKTLGDREWEGNAYYKLAGVYNSQCNFKQAIEHQKLHLSVVKELGDRSREEEAYCMLGCTYHRLGDFQQALECHKLHLSIAKELGNRASEEIAYCNICVVYNSMGNFKQAAENHKLHLNIVKELGNRDGERRAYSNLGNAYLGLGNFKQAIEYHNLCLNIAKELGNRDQEGIAYAHLGIAYQSLGNFKQAIEYQKRYLHIAKELGNRHGEGKAYGNLGITYEKMHHFQQAFECLKQSLSIAKEIGDRDCEGHAFGTLGLAFLSLGDFEQSMEYTKQALAIFKEVSNRKAEGFNHGTLGAVYSRLGNFKEAIKCYKEKLSIAKELGDKFQEAQSCCSLGHNYEWAGSLSEALNYFRSSVKILDDIRALLQSEDMLKISFRNDCQCAYISLWRALVKNGETDEALCTAEQARAQALTDVLKEKYGVASSPSASAEPKETISYILNNLTTETVFVALDTKAISFWLLRRGKEILFKQKEIDGDSCKLIDATLRDIAEGVRVMCEDRSMDEICNDSPSNREAAEETDQSPTSSVVSLRQLYDVIIGPIVDLLEGDQLLVVPEGPFGLAPYSALSETTRIRIVPSLTALQLITGAPESFHSRSGVLLVGDPCLEEVTNVFGKPVWKQLPFAREEVEMIGKLVKTTPLIGKDATKGEVLQRLKSVALVHIAAHGRAETGEILLTPNPGWTSPIPKEHYILTMSDVQAVRLRARLVVLSCCHSGRGEVKAEGVVGIARAFLCAGARSVLVSLWAIDDQATMEFMRHFYQHLADGKSASMALHQSTKSLRESEQFRDLKYWAPFVLIGDDVTLEFGEKE